MKARKILKWVVFTVVVINVMIIGAVLLGPSAPKPRPMPNPNGYDDFVRGAQLLNGDAYNYAKTNREALAALVSNNADALKILREGLGRDCLTPNDYSANYAQGLLPELSSFKKAAYFFCAEGRLAELNGHPNDAANSYLDAVRFGDQCSRGGVMISKLVGIACEAIGLQPLQSLSQSLEAKECTDIAHALETIDTQEESAEQTLQQEQMYARRVGGITTPFIQLLMHTSMQKSRLAFLAKFQASEVRRRKVMLDFAARAYELKQGKPPAQLADLVPDYLARVPQDPTTKTNIEYTPR